MYIPKLKFALVIALKHVFNPDEELGTDLLCFQQPHKRIAGDNEDLGLPEEHVGPQHLPFGPDEVPGAVPARLAVRIAPLGEDLLPFQAKLQVF